MVNDVFGTWVGFPQILVADAGTIMSWLLAKTGVTFPTYFGALILAAIARNTLGFISFKRNSKRVKGDKLLDMDRIISVGICGFGLGATPNAMANMSAVCYKYRYTVKPFLIVPIIGAMFADLINTGMITLFLNIL